MHGCSSLSHAMDSLEEKKIVTLGELLSIALPNHVIEKENALDKAGFHKSMSVEIFLRSFQEIIAESPKNMSLRVQEVYQVNICTAACIVHYLEPILTREKQVFDTYNNILVFYGRVKEPTMHVFGTDN